MSIIRKKGQAMTFLDSSVSYMFGAILTRLKGKFLFHLKIKFHE